MGLGWSARRWTATRMFTAASDDLQTIHDEKTLPTVSIKMHSLETFEKLQILQYYKNKVLYYHTNTYILFWRPNKSTNLNESCLMDLMS